MARKIATVIVGGLLTASALVSWARADGFGNFVGGFVGGMIFNELTHHRGPPRYSRPPQRYRAPVVTRRVPTAPPVIPTAPTPSTGPTEKSPAPDSEHATITTMSTGTSLQPVVFCAGCASFPQTRPAESHTVPQPTSQPDSEGDKQQAPQPATGTMLDASAREFIDRWRAVAPNVPIDRAAVLVALDQAIDGSAMAQLTNFRGEGWTRDWLRQAVLRRSTRMLPDQAQADAAPARLFHDASIALLQDVLTWQEAAAVTAGVERLEAKLANLQAPSRGLGPAGSPVDRVLARFPQILADIDTLAERQGVGTRGKLRARRIVLDCLSEKLGDTLQSAVESGPTIEKISDSLDRATSLYCKNWVGDAYRSPATDIDPVPIRAVWSEQGPTLDGAKWTVTLAQH